MTKRLERFELALLLVLKLRTLIVIQIVILYFIHKINTESNNETNVKKKLRHSLKIHIYKVPYHVVMVNKGFFCSGSLISSRGVLTAAHCVNDSRAEDILVKVGVKSIIEEGQVIKCIDVKIHEYYGFRSQIDHDIALVYLEDHVIFGDNVKKVMLRSLHPRYDSDNFTRVAVTSWGHGENKENNNLIMTEMKVTSGNECKKRFGNDFTDSMFCGKYLEVGCITDSGNPATANGKLVGIAILSTNCTITQNEDVVAFTNVTYLRKWVHINSQRLLSKYCTNRYRKVIRRYNNISDNK